MYDSHSIFGEMGAFPEICTKNLGHLWGKKEDIF
jgi:hypothetical protein